MTHRQGDLIHFWECRRQALDQLLANVTPPVEPRSFRQAHELYLLYLHSLLDLADDMDGNCGSIETGWRDALQGLGNLDGKYNASYLRELRNSAIKRGIDVTGAGQVASGQTCALSMTVQNKAGTQDYRPFDPWLRNIFYHAELALTPAIKPLVERLVEEAEKTTNGDLARTTRRGVIRADHMPPVIKGLALKILTETDLSWARDHQIAKLKQLLTDEPLTELRVTVRYLPGNGQAVG